MTLIYLFSLIHPLLLFLLFVVYPIILIDTDMDQFNESQIEAFKKM